MFARIEITANQALRDSLENKLVEVDFSEVVWVNSNKFL